MPFSFRNRITLTHGTRFSSDQSQVKLSAEGATENVLLQTPSREGKIGDATELVLSGGGYSSFEEAEQAGRRWRQHLMIAMARFGVGGDLARRPTLKLGEVTASSDRCFTKIGRAFRSSIFPGRELYGGNRSGSCREDAR